MISYVRNQALRRLGVLKSLVIILIFWLTSCTPQMLQELSRTLEEINAELESSYSPQTRSVQPPREESTQSRPWTQQEVVAWREYLAAIQDDICSTKIACRTYPGIEQNPNVGPFPTDAQLDADMKRTIQRVREYCNENPQWRLFYLKRQTDIHRKAAARNYQRIRNWRYRQ